MNFFDVLFCKHRIYWSFATSTTDKLLPETRVTRTLYVPVLQTPFYQNECSTQAISTGWRSQRWTGDKARNRKYESKCMLSQYICSNTAISRRYPTVARNASAGHSLRNIFRCIRSPSCVLHCLFLNYKSSIEEEKNGWVIFTLQD